MAFKSKKEYLQKILSQAGITIDGDKPYDITVHNEKLYDRVLSQGSLGFGEAYMEGWFDVPKLDEFFTRILRVKIDYEVKKNLVVLFHVLKAKLFNRQSLARAFQVGEEHYDIGNDLYEKMLDKRLVYSCGYWKDAQTLDEAQEAKLDLLCKKLKLKQGERVLDIGCGWGSFAKYAAEKYGVEVVGVTVSREQAEYARKACEGLPVTILLQDYRDTKGQYDKIVSIGMFEHVGYKNYNTFMKTAHRLLKDGGLFALHTIGSNRTVFATDPWIDKYIFPNGMLPSIKQVGASIEKRFVMEDWHNFGFDYYKTLMAWYENFKERWDELAPHYKKRTGGMFYRMWEYYLLASAGSFASRKNQLWQVILSKGGVERGYTSIR